MYPNYNFIYIHEYVILWLQRAQKISKIIQNRDSKQIFIMKMRESPRPDITIPMVNKKYFSE